MSGTEVAGGSPPADIDISRGLDVLPTAISVTTVVSEKWMEIDTPDAVVSGMEVAGGSPPADIDISGGPDVLQTAVSVTTVVSEEWMERFVINLDVLCSDGLVSGDDPAGGSSDVGSDVCVVLDPDTNSGVCADISCRKVDGPVCLRPGRVSVCFQDECGGPDVRAGRV